MYVKLFNQILDSSIAENRKLRHFFTDLLLCSDPDGNVLKTNEAISRATKASMEEVEWGLDELQKPDPKSNHQEYGGRRIIPLEGHGYGWKIVNYETYRDYKTAKQMRDETAARVRKHRENKKSSPRKTKAQIKAEWDSGERRYSAAYEAGDVEQAGRIAAENLPGENGDLV